MKKTSGVRRTWFWRQLGSDLGHWIHSSFNSFTNTQTAVTYQITRRVLKTEPRVLHGVSPHETKTVSLSTRGAHQYSAATGCIVNYGVLRQSNVKCHQRIVPLLFWVVHWFNV